MRLLCLALLLSILSETTAQTCDVVLAGYTPAAVEGGIHTFVLQFPNAENCGCNEYTQADGNTCENSGSVHVQNNETVSHIVMGIHYVDEETGLDYAENGECTSTTFHPGWSYVLNATAPPGGWQTGSATTIGINVPYAWECILNTPIEGYCWEVVIWQINISQTATYDDFPVDGWSAGTQGSGTQMYPDVDLSNNRISFCPDPVVTDTVYVYETDTVYVNLPPDTVIEFVSLEPDTVFVELPGDTIELLTVDTVYVPWEWYIYDTVYVDVFDTVYINTLDTVIVTETEIEYVYETDTLEIYQLDTVYTTLVDTILQEVIVYEYILETDTVYEYAVQFIDCETGLPCDNDGFIDEDCRSVFVPNTFTPNNDGINDSFYATMQYTDCWLDWHLQIYNRWGEMIWQTVDPDAQWYGEGPTRNYYVADGVYIWVLKAKGRNGLTLDLQGHVTVFR